MDLQLLSIYRDLKHLLPALRGVVLDVGSGQSPWRSLLSRDATYAAIDIPSGFEMSHGQCVLYDGISFPIRPQSCNAVISIEVLEHVVDLEQHLSEISKSLVRNGTFIATTPWSARIHYAPNDYRRLSQFGLDDLLRRSGFEVLRISPRGSQFAVIANKLLVKVLENKSTHNLVIRSGLLCVKVLLLGMPLAIIHFAALLSLVLHKHDQNDPLGWTIVARKS